MTSFMAQNAKRLAALAVVVALYFGARLPSLAHVERDQLAGRFRFEESILPTIDGPERRTMRPVHPSLTNIDGWISTVGASVGLNDLDGDGLPNDLCYVDVRTDQVIVAPVPGSPARFDKFVLDPGAKLFDRRTMCPTGVIPGDLNEDGLLDVVVYFWGRTPVAFLQRASAADAKLSAASFVVRDLVPTGERWFTNAGTRADIDGDGHIDLVIGNYFPDEAKILHADDQGPSQTMHASMSRGTNGGSDRILLFTGGSSGANGAEPQVTFRDVPNVLPEEVAKGWTLAIGAADLDGDGLPELYLGHDFGHDRMLWNRSQPGQPKFEVVEGRKTFTSPTSKVLGRDSFKGMGVDFGDLNDDGVLDIYVSNIASEFALEESHLMHVSQVGPTDVRSAFERGWAPYADDSEKLGLSRSGWGWESRLADFDNDGVLEALQATGFLQGTTNRWPELHEVAMGNDQLLHSPGNWHKFRAGDDLSGHDVNPFFVRSANGRYYDLAKEVGVGRIQVSRGIATADVDGDGKLDMAVANQWEDSRFFHNRSTNKHKFLGLNLLLPIGGAAGPTQVMAGQPTKNVRGYAAVGASIKVTASPKRTLIAQVDGGNGHSGKRSHQLLFGLGDVDEKQPVRVEIRWRDAQGKLHQQTFDQQLTPGWHTIVLGRSPQEG